MQSFLRTICRAGRQGTSKFVDFRSSQVIKSTANIGPYKSLPEFSLSGTQTDASTRFSLLSQSPAKDQSFMKLPRPQSWSSPCVVPNVKNATFHHNGVFLSGFVGKASSMRHLSTMANSEVSLEQQNSSSSPAVVHPPRIKFKRLDKTAKHIMNILDKEAVEKVRSEREIVDLKPGHIIQMKLEVPENKRRTSVIKGIVIARRNAGLNTTFRLRRLVFGVGVESVFPLYSPNIKELKILDKMEVRRAKLYYLRDRMNPLKK